MDHRRIHSNSAAIAQHSARVILINNGSLALIERVRDGSTYYVFPGGRVEPGETPAQAAIREAHEELGLDINPLREVAQIQHGDIIQHYFLSQIIGGQFGSGDGPEMIGQYPPERGTYTAVWLSLDSLPCHNIVPNKLCTWLLTSLRKGWPARIYYGED